MEENITGKRIKDLRLLKGMTLEELGNKVGVTKSQMRKYETGDTPNIKRDRVIDIAHALDIHPGYLFGFMEYEEAKKVHSHFISAHEIERECVDKLLVEVSKLTDEQVKALTVIVKGMQK